MTQESVLRIVIDSRNAERNAHALANELESIEKKGDYATKSMDSMSVATRQLAGYMAGIVTIGAAINKMDAYTSINNKLKLVTNSQAELNQAMQDTFAIAQRSASAWGAVNDVYSKYMSNAKTLNLTQTQTARLTEITSKAVAISGSTTESAAGALFQYGQALDGNILRSEEYNALVDGAGGLLGAMAKGLGVTRGELRQMMLDGKLTGEVITKALLKAGDSVDELFNKTDITIGQSLTILNDSVTKFVGEASTGSGAATVLAGSIRVLAENLDLIADGAIVLGIGYITTAIATKTVAVKEDIVATLAQRAITQAQAIEEVKLATAATNNAKAHLALTQATAAATQAKFGATAAATKYKMATDAVTQAVIRQEVAEKAAFGATVNMSRASAGLLGFLGGPLGIGLTLATVAAGYMLMRDNASKATAAIDIQGQSVDDLVVKYRELNTLQRDNETKALTDQMEGLSLKFRVASSDLASFMQALPVSDEKINTWSKLHSQFSLGKISSDDYYKSIKALNILNDDQLNKVRGLIGGYESSNTKVKEAETAQKALATATKKTTQEVKDQAVSVANLSEEIKKLLKESNQSIKDSSITSALASRGYNDTMIELAKKYLNVEGAIVKDAQGQKVLRDDLKKALQAEYQAIMKAKNAVDARNESEKERTKELEKQQKVLQVNSKVQANAVKYNFAGLETKNGLPKGLLSAIQMQESRGDTYRNGKLLTSPAGAQGSFQFMPATAKRFNVNVEDMASSAEGAAKYLGKLLKMFGGDVDKAIMAYNAGEGNVQSGKAYSFKETKNYREKINGYMAGSAGFKQGDISAKEFDRIIEESTRVAIEQAKARTQLEVDVSNEVEKIRTNLQAKLDEIDAANFSPEKAKELKAEYQARADNDIAIAQYALKTKLNDYESFRKSEEALLKESFDQKKFYAARDLELTKEDRKKAVALLEGQYQQELALVKLAKEQRIFQAEQAMMTEIQVMQERYRLERDEIIKTTATDLEERRRRLNALNTDVIRGGVGKNFSDPNDTGSQFLKSISYASVPESNTQRLDNEFAKEQAKMLANFEKTKELNAANHEAILEAERIFLDAKQQLQDEYDFKAQDARRMDYEHQLSIYGQMTSMVGSSFGQMMDIVSQVKEENTKTYKTFFAINKAIAFAQAIINTEEGATKALAQGGIYGAALAMAVRASGYASAGIIAGQAIAGPGGEGYANGGYTGHGGKYEPAGIVHKGEGVLTKEEVEALGGPQGFEDLRNSIRRGYSTGGLVADTHRVGMGAMNAINNGGAIQAEKQAQANAKVQSQNPQVIDNNLRVIMVKDENEAKDWLYSPEGERAFLYHMKRNRSKV